MSALALHEQTIARAMSPTQIQIELARPNEDAPARRHAPGPSIPEALNDASPARA